MQEKDSERIATIEKETAISAEIKSKHSLRV